MNLGSSRESFRGSSREGRQLSEDLDATYSFIFTDYDQDPRVLRGSYEGLKSPKKVRNKKKTLKHGKMSVLLQGSCEVRTEIPPIASFSQSMTRI